MLFRNTFMIFDNSSLKLYYSIILCFCSQSLFKLIFLTLPIRATNHNITMTT